MISAKDVPGNLRPLMSCALWRLHESIDRNDANELFLLSDQPEIRTVAQKLNIIVRSSKELGVLITAKAKRLDLDAYGDLERDFDLPRRVINRPELKPITHVEGQEAPEKSESNGTKSEDSKNASESREEKGKTLDDNASEDEGNAVPSKDSEEPHGRKSSENEDEETPAKVTVAKMLENSATVLGLTDLIAKSEPDGNGKRQEETASNGSSPNTSDADHSDIAALRHQKPDEAQTKADSAASNSFSSKNASTYSTPENRILKYDSSPARSSALPPLLRPNAPAQEPEDSDEEVVVFVPQPKRFSNHKKPIQQNSRPATPITQPHKQFFDQSPKASPIAAQVQSKPPSRGRNSTITSHGHPQPTSAPTIIDPDAFGRDFAVNTNSGPRTLPNHRPHHRQKRSTENAQLTPNSHDRRQHDPRISPNRQLPHTRSPRLSPARQPNSEEGQSTQSQRPHRTSPQRRSKPSEPKEATFRGRGPNHANPGANPELKSLATRMVESEEFVPRSAFTESQNGSMFAQPSIVEPQNLIPKAASPAIQDKPTTPKAQFVKPESFTPRNSEPTSQNKPRVIEPRASGADGFVPRSAMTRMPYKPRIPEPEVIEPRSSMPDVQYVLKSGSTRAATRGRGRLWTPS